MTGTSAPDTGAIPLAYAGIAGAFAEEALVARFGEPANRVGLDSFDAVFAAVAGGSARAGVVPIENSLAGSVLENYDLLLEHQLHVVGEVSLPVRHCLLGPVGATLQHVAQCRSHPQALAQCARFLTAHGIEPLAASNTAVAARDVAAGGDPQQAAVASARAGRLHGLEVIASNIQTRDDNTTRFFVIEQERPGNDHEADKASIAFTTRNQPGALLACLQTIADAGLNLTKLESRPTGAALWEYTFYADIEADGATLLTAGHVTGVLLQLESRATSVRLLGRYLHANVFLD